MPAVKKSPQAFRTISEVADWLELPAHVLRFWESRFSEISPVKGAGGRRYYRPEDMKLLGGIKYLLHEQGRTIKSVQDLLASDGAGSVAALCPATTSESEQRARPEARPPEQAKTVPSPVPEPADAAPAAPSQDASEPQIGYFFDDQADLPDAAERPDAAPAASLRSIADVAADPADDQGPQLPSFAAELRGLDFSTTSLAAAKPVVAELAVRLKKLRDPQ